MEIGDAKTRVYLSASRPETKLQTFAYASLDLSQRSIRLVQIAPHLSPSGLIQCELRHSSIESEYTCLSYVWGPPDKGHDVMINGTLVTVRLNLFRFLQAARPNRLQWLWIDALCIDQLNHAERTHQVQQMGLVFSRAARTVSWLGTRPEVVDFVRRALVNTRGRVEHFRNHEYWTRAWVTQEVLLARQIVLMAGVWTLHLERVPEAMIDDCSNDLIRAHLLTRKHPCASDNIRGKSLVSLLCMFRSQNCETLHDRVFSLLGLCNDRSKIEVNYDLSSGELARKVLLSSGDSICLCGVRAVTKILNVGHGSRMDSDLSNHEPQLPAEMTLPVSWYETIEDLTGDDWVKGNATDFSWCWRTGPHAHCRITGPSVKPTSFSLVICLVHLCDRTLGRLSIQKDPGSEDIAYGYTGSRKPGRMGRVGPFRWPGRFEIKLKKKRNSNL